MGCGGSVYDNFPTLRQYKLEYDTLGLKHTLISTLYNNWYIPNVINEGEEMDFARFCAATKVVKAEHCKVLRMVFGMGPKDQQVAFKDFVYGCWSICTISSSSRKYITGFFMMLYADITVNKKKTAVSYNRFLEMIQDTAGNVARETERWKKLMADYSEFNKDKNSLTFKEIGDHYDDDSGGAELPFQYFFFNLQLLLIPTLSNESWEALATRRFEDKGEYMEAKAWVEKEMNKNFTVVDTSRFSIRMSVWQGKGKAVSPNGKDAAAEGTKDGPSDQSGSQKKKKKKATHTSTGEGVVRRVTKMMNMQNMVTKKNKIASGDGGGRGDKKSPSDGGIAGRVKRLSMAVTSKVGAAVGRKTKERERG